MARRAGGGAEGQVATRPAMRRAGDAEGGRRCGGLAGDAEGRPAMRRAGRRCGGPAHAG